MTKQPDVDTGATDRPALEQKLLEEIAYEIRCWDTDRDLSHAQLALRIFELVRGNEARIAANDCPDLWRQIATEI